MLNASDARDEDIPDRLRHLLRLDDHDEVSVGQSRVLHDRASCVELRMDDLERRMAKMESARERDRELMGHVEIALVRLAHEIRKARLRE